MNKLKNIFNSFKNLWFSQYLSFNILIILLLICYFIMISSLFFPHLDSFGNLAIIRTAFSSIIGYLLESSTRHVLKCSAKAIKIRNIIVGIITLVSVLIITHCYFNSTPIEDPSLILIKNNLFTCIGFLISTSEKCSPDE